MPHKSLRSSRRVKNTRALRGVYRGEPVTFVDASDADLGRSIDRIADFARQARRALKPLLRSKRAEVVLADFQLGELEKLDYRQVPKEFLAQAAVSSTLLLMSVADELDAIDNAGSKWIKQAIFLLRYGGLHVKREDKSGRQPRVDKKWKRGS